MCTTYCYFSTCGPRNSPQKGMWPFAIKSLEVQALSLPSGVLPSGFPTKTLHMSSGSEGGKHDVGGTAYKSRLARMVRYYSLISEAIVSSESSV